MRSADRQMPFLTYLPLGMPPHHIWLLTNQIAYPRYAASSLASNDFVRSMLGAAMPLASYPLFHNLGIDWGNTLLGFVSLVFLPIPYVPFLSSFPPPLLPFLLLLLFNDAVFDVLWRLEEILMIDGYYSSMGVDYEIYHPWHYMMIN